MRGKISFVLKILVVICSLGAFVIGLIFTNQDSITSWSTRLLYFTWQSNIWLGITFVLVIINGFSKGKRKNEWKKRLYFLKYITTVCITITFIVFNVFLLPFAPPEYKLLTVVSIMAHNLSPIFAITDFFVDEYTIPLSIKQAFATTIPPLIYTLMVFILSTLHVDFGRGEDFPYYFMNMHSPAGFFGFSKIPPYFVGTFYWIVGLASVVVMIALLYAKLKIGGNNKIKR